MGMQGEMSLLGQVDCPSECCHLMSTLHPPGVSVCIWVCGFCRWS